MQAIVWLKTLLNFANGEVFSVMVCNIESRNADSVEIVFEGGQKLLVNHVGMIVDESIESSKWFVTDASGNLMAGACDISFSA